MRRVSKTKWLIHQLLARKHVGVPLSPVLLAPFWTRSELCCCCVCVCACVKVMQVLLVALFSSVLLVQVSGDLAYSMLLKFVSELTAARGGETLLVPEQEEEEAEGGRQEVMRRHLPLTQRERKAGCRNFFWKTFTSC
uniref:Somatostatin/Cortistatin C-terminal domain-containing protein n=1 Tax=Gasterosteus aculeatus aculeatus TaxID=481459 RepID=A0AAQ4PND9_GASAC